MKRIRVISLAVIAALSLTVTSFAAEKSPQQSAAAYLSEAGIMLGNESGDMMLEQGLTPEDILGQVFGDLGVVFLDTVEVSYKCYCSRSRVESVLISLGKKELTEIMEEGKSFPVECQFCDQVYRFTPEEIRELLKKV